MKCPDWSHFFVYFLLKYLKFISSYYCTNLSKQEIQINTRTHMKLINISTTIRMECAIKQRLHKQNFARDAELLACLSPIRNYQFKSTITLSRTLSKPPQQGRRLGRQTLPMNIYHCTSTVNNGTRTSSTIAPRARRSVR